MAIILYNFTTMIMNCIHVTQKEGKVKKVSFSNAVDICRDFIIHRMPSFLLSMSCRQSSFPKENQLFQSIPKRKKMSATSKTMVQNTAR
jgi:hypothetical protein